jgi:ComEC/Rec2-related protein
VIRAGVAGALASLAWLTGRLRDAWQALLLGAAVLLAWNPYVVFDAGFQLSFAAVVAIFTVAPRLSASLEYSPLPQNVRLVVAVTLACSVFTAPILWLQFGYLPLLGVVANVLAEPRCRSSSASPSRPPAWMPSRPPPPPSSRPSTAASPPTSRSAPTSSRRFRSPR